MPAMLAGEAAHLYTRRAGEASITLNERRGPLVAWRRRIRGSRDAAASTASATRAGPAASPGPRRIARGALLRPGLHRRRRLRAHLPRRGPCAWPPARVKGSLL